MERMGCVDWEMQLDILKGGRGIEQDAKFHAQLAEVAGNRTLKIVISTCSDESTGGSFGFTVMGDYTN